MKFYKIIIFSIIVLLVYSCSKPYMPKPYGYFRVYLPPHTYRTIDTLGLPYTFDVSTTAKIVSRPQKHDKYWIDIEYPYLNASVFCTYKTIHHDLKGLSDDARKYVYKNSVRADGINEKTYKHPQNHVYGILYDLIGNTASNLQFVLTDSTKHFFRAALYFNDVPNKDSIAPMSKYIRKDMIRLMESFQWKK